MNDFTIKDLERISGIKAHTLRVWEQRYNFLKPRRTTTNIRYYSNDELKAVLNISLLNRFGFKVSKIDRMDFSEIEQQVEKLEGIEARRERLINNLLAEMSALNEKKFEAIISGYISAEGLEEALMEVIFPFLERTGIFWKSGDICPAQEKLAVNIIRQKLIVAIETTVPSYRSDVTSLLYLPEGVRQEIGLLFIYYLLKKRGVFTIYLGTDVPIQDVEYIVKQKKPQIAFVHISYLPPDFVFEKFISDIRYRLGGMRTIISGHPSEHCRKRTPGCTELKTSLPALLETINSL